MRYIFIIFLFIVGYIFSCGCIGSNNSVTENEELDTSMTFLDTFQEMYGEEATISLDIEEKIYKFDFFEDGFYGWMYTETYIGNESAIEAWDAFVELFKNYSKELVGVLSGYSFQVSNPYNNEKIILIIKDGEVLYDFTSEIPPTPITPAPTTNPSNEYLTYENLGYNIKIAYPPGWEILERPMINIVVMFTSPPQNVADTFFENISVGIESLSYNISLEDYVDLSLYQLRSYITNYQLIEEGPTTIDGNPAYMAVITGTQGVYAYKWKVYFSVVSNKAYFLTYTAKENDYSYFLYYIENMVYSFEII